MRRYSENTQLFFDKCVQFTFRQFVILDLRLSTQGNFLKISCIIKLVQNKLYIKVLSYYLLYVCRLVLQFILHLKHKYQPTENLIVKFYFHIVT